MVKFSIIIPVYNVEKYIKKCLDSVYAQSYKDYEVIVVDDGTEDKSMDIVKNYPAKVIHQKNSGLSAARNRGLKEARGEYLLFLDSDDFIEKDLLKEIHKSLKNNPDLVRFQAQTVDEENNIKPFPEKGFINATGVQAFEKISQYHFVENASCYVIKKEYFLKNKFEFKKGTIHEDFGLIPLVIIKANTVNSLEYIGYNYLQRKNSIMSEKNYEKTKKKVEDFYQHYLYLKEEIDKTKLDSVVFKSFIANSLIIKICELERKEYKQYRKKLKEKKVYDDLLVDNGKRRIKKVLFKISPKMTKRFLK